MRLLAIAFITITASCSSYNTVDPADCGVPIFDGEATSGLINPTPEMQKAFLGQLQKRDRRWAYCWYKTADGEIELTVGDFGHFFILDGESWKYDKTRTYIIMWHQRR